MRRHPSTVAAGLLISGVCLVAEALLPATAWGASGNPAMVRLTVPDGYANVTVKAINNRGVVIGSAASGAGYRAIRWDADGAITELPTLAGAIDSDVAGINDRGTIAGNAFFADGHTQAVQWDRSGRITNLGTVPGGIGSASIGIGEDGTIFGNVEDAGGIWRAVRWNRTGRLVELPTLGGGDATATVSNDVGMAAGTAATPATAGTPATSHAVAWTGTGQIIDTQAEPDAPGIWPIAINNLGTVIGPASAVIWNRWRGFTTLRSVAGSSITMTRAINDSDTVAGEAWAIAPDHSVTSVRVVRWDRSGAVSVLASLPGVDRNYATAIDRAGTIVGSARLASGVWHAMRWDRTGAVTDLGDASSSDWSEAIAVNDTGMIAGYLHPDATTDNVPVVWHARS